MANSISTGSRRPYGIADRRADNAPRGTTSMRSYSKHAYAKPACAKPQHHRWRTLFVVLLAIFVPLNAAQAQAGAQVSAKAVQVAGRVLGFLSPPMSGDVKLGIVYDPAIPASAADEQALLGILGSGLQVAGVNLIPVPIPIANLSSAQAGVFFLTSGLGAEAAQVGTAAAAGKILCITADTSATQSGACAVSVQTDPKVVITVNKTAAAQTSVTFASAFMLMITEI